MLPITVLMKTFRRPRGVLRAYQSIRRFYPIIPIIIADDSDTPAPLPTHDPHLTHLQLPFDVGISAGRNAALDLVQTPFFLQADDDFFFTHHTNLAELLAILLAQNVDILAAQTRDITPCLGGLGHTWQPTDWVTTLNLDPAAQLLRLGYMSDQLQADFVRCDMATNFFLAQTEAVRKLAGWDSAFKVGEHIDFFLRAKLNQLRVGYTARVWVEHHRNYDRNQAYSEYRERTRESRQQFMEKYNLLWFHGKTPYPATKGLFIHRGW